jgi:hypothetical protein
VTSIFPRLRGTGAHRADDRIAELERQMKELTAGYEARLSELREENVVLLNRQAAADDFFMIQDQYTTEVEQELAEEKRAHAATQADLQARTRWVADLERRLADAERRLDARKLAETAVTETQELDVAEIRRHCVMPLHQAPFATTDPGRVPPSWARKDEPAA